MNLPEELIIKRDSSRIKLTNKGSIIEFINSYDNIEVLEKYLNALKKQQKLKTEEIDEIINATESRLSELETPTNNFLNQFNEVKNDNNALANFYESQIFYLNGIFNDIKNNKAKDRQINIMLNFLRFCVDREKNEQLQNFRTTQMLFDKFFQEYREGKIVLEIKYIEIIETIAQIKFEVLNKVDDSAMDYAESGYQTAKTYALTNNPNKGHALTEDDNITKLGSAAFITTAIVLQATLLLTLILSLLALVK